MKSWLLFSGVNKDVMPPKPKYEVKLPTVCTSDQISSILGAADDYMALAIRLALQCGLPEQELIYLEWSDLNTDEKLVRIQGKPQYNFKVKDSEQREVLRGESLPPRTRRTDARCPPRPLRCGPGLGFRPDRPVSEALPGSAGRTEPAQPRVRYSSDTFAAISHRRSADSRNSLLNFRYFRS
jgi:integrase